MSCEQQARGAFINTLGRMLYEAKMLKYWRERLETPLQQLVLESEIITLIKQLEGLQSLASQELRRYGGNLPG
jgi:hypothetical protein